MTAKSSRTMSIAINIYMEIVIYKPNYVNRPNGIARPERPRKTPSAPLTNGSEKLEFIRF